MWEGLLNEGRGRRVTRCGGFRAAAGRRGCQDSPFLCQEVKQGLVPKGAKFPGPAGPCLPPCTCAHKHFYGVRGKDPRGPGSPASLPVTLPTAVIHKQERPTRPPSPNSPNPEPRGATPSLCQPPRAVLSRSGSAGILGLPSLQAQRGARDAGTRVALAQACGGGAGVCSAASVTRYADHPGAQQPAINARTSSLPPCPCPVPTLPPALI